MKTLLLPAVITGLLLNAWNAFSQDMRSFAPFEHRKICPGHIKDKQLALKIENLKIARPLTTGLPDTDNHDGSNILFADGEYHFWITEHFGPEYDGFKYTRIDYCSSKDGLNWTRHNEPALAPDPGLPWESVGVLTCYVVPHEGRYYIFYTGVGDDWGTKGAAYKRLLYAVADQPGGPWKRPENNLVLESSDPDGWEGPGGDDVNILFKDGKWWMYYKGRPNSIKSWQDTLVGVAFADNLTGSYTKYEKNPLMYGHAFAVWKQGRGFAAMPSNGRTQTLWYSEDGLDFRDTGIDMPGSTPGVFCPDNYVEGYSRGIRWYIDTASPPQSVLKFPEEHRAALRKKYPADEKWAGRMRIQERRDADLWLGNDNEFETQAGQGKQDKAPAEEVDLIKDSSMGY
jgi:hypothetical protein